MVIESIMVLFRNIDNVMVDEYKAWRTVLYGRRRTGIGIGTAAIFA